MTSPSQTYYRVGPYVLVKKLGEGAFGKVKLAVHRHTNQNFACKIIDKSKVRERLQSSQVQTEIEIMQRLSHRNIVRLIDVYSTSRKIYIIMELISGGELFGEIVRLKRLPESYARFFFRQLVDGVQHCHEQGVYHRDLKPENLLLSEDKTLKITDFGVAKLKYGEESNAMSVTGSINLHTQCGTPNYVAPEIITLDSKGYKGTRVDVWACGVILFVLVAGALPFDSPKMDVLFEMILKAQVTYPSHFSADLVDLISNMLKTDPSERYTLADVKQHPWFNGFVIEDIDPFLSPSSSNPASSPSIESSQPAQPDNAHEEVPMVNIMPQFSPPSRLSKYAPQGFENQSAQRPNVRMSKIDTLDIGKRVETGEIKAMVQSFISQRVVITSSVPSVTSSDDDLQGVHRNGNPCTPNSANSRHHTDPLVPPEMKNSPNPTDRFPSHALGNRVFSSDSENEFEEAQEIRLPARPYHSEGSNKLEGLFDEAEANQDKFQQSSEPKSQNVQDENRSKPQSSSEEQHNSKTESLDQPYQSPNHVSASHKESGEQSGDNFDSSSRKSFTSAGEQSRLGNRMRHLGSSIRRKVSELPNRMSVSVSKLYRKPSG